MANKEKEFLNFYLKHLYEYAKEEKRNIMLISSPNAKTKIKLEMKNSWNDKLSLSEFISSCPDKTIANLYCGNLSIYQQSHVYHQAWENANIDERKKLSLHFYKLASQFEYDHLSFFDLLKKQEDSESIDIFLKNAPATVLNKDNDINNIVSYIKRRNQENNKEILFHFLVTRKFAIIKLKNTYEKLAHDLMEYYEGDGILEEYAKYFPKINAQMKAKESDSIFYQQENNELQILIDYEKLIAVGNLVDKKYDDWLSSFLSIFSLKDKRINNIKHVDFRLSNRKEYKQIFIYVKENKILLEVEVKEILVDFIKSLTPSLNQSCQANSDKKEYAHQWISHYFLTKELEEQALNTQKIQPKL